MRKTVWVLYRFKWRGVPDMGIVSKGVWQSRYAGWDKRQLQPHHQPLTDIQYITESNDKQMLEKMKELAKEQ